MFGKLLQILSAATQKLRHVLSNFSASIKTHLEFTRSNKLCQRSGFLDLPVEIIQMIQDLLPLASTVSLALTCRDMRKILGDKPLRSINLPVNVDQRKDFLLGLQKDLSDWQFCHPCSVFHPLQKEVDARTIWRHDEPDCVQISGRVSFLPNFRVRYQHAQLVMNRYRFGTLHKDDLGILSYESVNSYGGQRVITPSIEDGGLAIYMTTTLRLMGCWHERVIRYRLPQVCHHRARIDGSPQYTLEAAIHCQLNHDAKQSCIDCAQWKSCPTCQTIFFVKLQAIHTAEIVVQLDTRKWLGPCETPMDPYWWRHCDRLPAVKGQPDRWNADISGRALYVARVRIARGGRPRHGDTAEGERGSDVIAKGVCVVQ